MKLIATIALLAALALPAATALALTPPPPPPPPRGIDLDARIYPIGGDDAPYLNRVFPDGVPNTVGALMDALDGDWLRARAMCAGYYYSGGCDQGFPFDADPDPTPTPAPAAAAPAADSPIDPQVLVSAASLCLAEANVSVQRACWEGFTAAYRGFRSAAAADAVRDDETRSAAERAAAQTYYCQNAETPDATCVSGMNEQAQDGDTTQDGFVPFNEEGTPTPSDFPEDTWSAEECVTDSETGETTCTGPGYQEG